MPQLKTQISEVIKSQFSKLAQERNISEAELLRLLVLKELTNLEHEKTEFIDKNDSVERKRLNIRLPEILLNAASKKAQYKGMTLNKWVVSLIQTNITGNPVLSEDEFIDLKESNRNLLAIGRNLNQITKFATANKNIDKLKITLLEAINKTIIDNKLLIVKALRASHNTWSTEHE